MKRNKLYVVIIIMLLLIESCTLFLMYKSLSNKKIEDMVSKEKIINNNTFAIMIEQEDGTYKESEDNKWPSDGYIYSESKSGCVDKNGNKLKGMLTYNTETNVATVDTTSTSHCYLYFDKKPVCTLADDSKVSAGEYGAKYNCKVDPNRAPYTFYLMSNKEDGTSDLIMNANINANGESVIPGVTQDYGIVEWDDYYYTHKGPLTSLNFLYNATKSWTNVEPLNYSFRNYSNSYYKSFVSNNGFVQITNSSGRVVSLGSLSEPFRSRLPVSSTSFDDSEIPPKTDETSFFYENMPTSWENLISGYKGPIGYWTMSAYTEKLVLYIGYNSPTSFSLNSPSNIGVRPIINVKLN